jgi:hypothetical protein
MELDIEIGVKHQCELPVEGENKRICNICLESEEKEEIKPSFADKIIPLKNEKGEIINSWPKIKMPQLTEKEEEANNANSYKSDIIGNTSEEFSKTYKTTEINFRN